MQLADTQAHICNATLVPAARKWAFLLPDRCRCAQLQHLLLLLLPLLLLPLLLLLTTGTDEAK